MSAVAIPQAVKRVTGRLMLAVVAIALVVPLGIAAGWLVALLVWAAALSVIGLLLLGLKWGFD